MGKLTLKDTIRWIRRFNNDGTSTLTLQVLTLVDHRDFSTMQGDVEYVWVDVPTVIEIPENKA